MMRSFCLKLSVLCVSFVSLAGTASAQSHIHNDPFAPAAPTVHQGSFTDDVLDQMFRKVDPNCTMEVQPDGSKLYAFHLNRGNGVQLLMVVNVTPTKLTVLSMVKDPYLPPVSVEEMNRLMVEPNKKLAPVFVFAKAVDGNKAAVFAIREIERSVADETFIDQWNTFLQVATDLRIACNENK